MEAGGRSQRQSLGPVAQRSVCVRELPCSAMLGTAPEPARGRVSRARGMTSPAPTLDGYLSGSVGYLLKGYSIPACFPTRKTGCLPGLTVRFSLGGVGIWVGSAWRRVSWASCACSTHQSWPRVAFVQGSTFLGPRGRQSHSRNWSLQSH